MLEEKKEGRTLLTGFEDFGVREKRERVIFLLFIIFRWCAVIGGLNILIIKATLYDSIDKKQIG